MIGSAKTLCPGINPETFLTDFEKAGISAFKNAFSDADAGGGRFQLALSIMRRCDGALMKNKEVSDINFRFRVEALTALSFI